MMMIFIVVALSILLTFFTPVVAFISNSKLHPSSCINRFRSTDSLHAIIDVTSVSDFDSKLKESADKLIVIDYSTTWCGPCKMVFPKYEELSGRNEYADVVFLKCIGDASVEASALMKREGVRSVPSFHLWKSGKKLDSVNGARIEEVEGAIKSYLK